MNSLTKNLCTTSLVATMALASTAQAEVKFWTMPYGDQLVWNETIANLIEGFEAESGIDVTHEILPWSSSRSTQLAIAQGGDAPDCADMWWLHSFSAIGGDKHGPMPINEYEDRLDIPGFYPGAMQDATWKGDLYGIPWRGDIRSLLYRTDFAAEAGFDSAPETWADVVEAAKAMTVRDDNGNVTRWGYSFGTSSKITDWMLPLYWQAGGEMMTEDGLTATIDNDAMREALTYMHDMVHVHKVVDIDSFEKGYEPLVLFADGQIAMFGSAQQQWGKRLDVDYAGLDGNWAFARSAAGSDGRDSFSGAGYFGLLRGTEKVEECISLLEYLARDESMQVLSEASGNVGTKPAVMASEFWSDRPWKQVVGAALEDAHTSQHPAPAWSAISTPEPGGIVYDLIYNTVVLQQDMDAEIAKAQELMQAELSR